MKRSRVGLSLVVLLLLLAIVAGGVLYTVQTMGRSVSRSEFLMGTVMDITAYGPRAGQAIEAAFDRIRQVEKETGASGVDIGRVNARAGRSATKVSPDTWSILSTAARLQKETGGAFDVTVGPLVEIWGFGYGGSGRLPSSREIDRTRKIVGGGQLDLLAGDHSVALKTAGMRVDLGGVAKGFAVEEAVKVLRSYGIGNALVNAGKSSIKVVGNGPRGKGWRIGIGNPRSSGKIVGIITLRSGQSIGTSSDTQRYFVKNGRRYSHLIDPRTGYPAEGLSLVTVVTDDATEADILSTALFINGESWGVRYLSRTKKVQAVFVDNKGRTWASRGLPIQKDTD